MKIIGINVFFLFSLVGGFTQDVSHEPGVYKFIPNKGQWPDWVKYRAELDGGKIWLEEKGILYQFRDYSEAHEVHIGKSKNDNIESIPQHLLYAEFVGANEVELVEEKYPTKEYYNFYLGNDPDKWASKLHAYNELTFNELYDGIDMRFYEQEAQLKYEFHVSAGADPTEIAIHYHGEEKIKKDRDGNIKIKTSLGSIIEQKPYAYQIKNGKILKIQCEFKLSDDGLISFDVGKYDQNIELVIDPVLIFATYCGSVTDNFGMTATYAYDGKAYSGGVVYGNAYPTPGPAYDINSNFTGPSSANYGITDVFISKYSADGTTMLWSTYLGGGDDIQGTETVHSLIADTSNNIYLYGATSSTDFPIQNGVQTTHAGGTPGSNYYYNGVYFSTQGTDIFVSKFSEDGTALLGSTYVGGTANDGINYRIGGGTYNSVAAYDSLTTNYGDQFRGEIMLDSANNIYIASSTRSTDFPVANSFQNTIGGKQDGVVFKLAADFNSLLWSSFYGGSENDAAYSVKVDSSYNVLVAGSTCSSDLPGTTGGLNTVYQGGKTDGFVVKIVPDGSTLTQASYIGTASYDQVIFVEIDRWDNVYLVGQSNGGMPVVNAPYANANSGQFIMKLTPDLTSIVYSTVFGSGSGSFDISPSAFLVDVCGNVYVSGWGANILQSTPLGGMPTTSDAYQQTPPNGFDFYLFVMERDALSLLYGSYMGGSSAQEHVDGGTSRFDKFGVVYQSVCGGCGGYSDFPTTSGAWSDQNLSSNCNNLVFKYDFEIVPNAEFQISDIEGCAPFTFILDNESSDTINSVWTFPPEANIISGGASPEIMFTDPGQYEIILSITDTICNLQDTALKIINVYDALELQAFGDTVLCGPQAVDIYANSNGTATEFLWYDDPAMINPINTGGLDSAITVNPGQITTYYVHATNGWVLCDLTDSVTIYMAEGGLELDDTEVICLGDTAVITAQNLIPSETITYSWAPASEIIQQNDSIIWVSPPSSMWFYTTGTTSSGCILYDSIWVEVTYIDPGSVYATASPDSIPEGGTSTLAAYPDVAGYTYIWIPTIGLNTNVGQTVVASPEQDTEYTVIIEGEGCTQKTSVTVYVLEFICGDVYIFVPNAFSPNGDGENDMLYVRGQNLEQIDFKVFDRWGELVFETQDQSVGWDGTYKGKPVDPDVFVYHLQAVCFDGQESLIKGNVTVLK
ncbi:MAG: gliding motility-associated C-terminal domain-containing protein [Crocinitomicaceae bacterium]